MSELTKQLTIQTDAEDLESLPSTFNMRLMFYLKCVCKVLFIESSEIVFDLNQKPCLENVELDKLLKLCTCFSPDLLMNKCFFEDESKTPDRGVTFYPVDHFKSWDVPLEIVIWNESRKVQCIMCCQKKFILEKYHQPMNFYRNRLLAIERKEVKQQSKRTCCSLS